MSFVVHPYHERTVTSADLRDLVCPHLTRVTCRFSDAIEARAMKVQEKYYMLRPEVIESYFVLWRLTGDQKYRDWGWEAAQVLTNWGWFGWAVGYLSLRLSRNDAQLLYF